MTPEERDDFADDHGYVRYRCRRHGQFWSDTGPYCERCGEPEALTGDDADAQGG